MQRNPDMTKFTRTANGGYLFRHGTKTIRLSKPEEHATQWLAETVVMRGVMIEKDTGSDFTYVHAPTRKAAIERITELLDEQTSDKNKLLNTD